MCLIVRQYAKCDGFNYFVYKKRTYSKKNRFKSTAIKVNVQSIKKK